MGIKVLDPTLGIESELASLAPPLGSLQGASVGLIDNAKIGVARFYDHLEDILKTRYGVREFIRRRKPDTSRPVPAEMLADLRGTDAIISAIGD